MHNIWVRLNAVIFFALTVLLGLAILCALSSYLHKPLPILNTLKLNELKSFRSHSGNDIALLFFDLDADLRRYICFLYFIHFYFNTYIIISISAHFIGILNSYLYSL
jgi:hypothetical protein